MARYEIVAAICLALIFSACAKSGNDKSPVSLQVKATQSPNIIILLADDMGYGDMGAFGHPTIQTPALDKLAAEGQKWTSFYMASSACSPSRAALLTGRYPVRNGMAPTNPSRWTLLPDSTGGLPEEEITIAELLKTRGYKTAAVGKWHLGHQPEFMPTRQGFDSYYGIPFSNDMMPARHRSIHVLKKDPSMFSEPQPTDWGVPLMENEVILEQPADQRTITRRYTERAIDFIQTSKDEPFFLYLAYSMPHVPAFASPDFQGKSVRGVYGDAMEEIDWSVGQIIDNLKSAGLADNTLVVFTSDNGPWLIMDQYGGSAGLLKGGKGTTWEGGVRAPTLFWGPGFVTSQVVTDMGSSLDLLPTIAALAGTDMVGSYELDGYNLTSVLSGADSSPRDILYYYRFQTIHAIRKGRYKAHFITADPQAPAAPGVVHQTPLLFDLNVDPAERYNIADRHPELIAELIMLRDSQEAELMPLASQLDIY